MPGRSNSSALSTSSTTRTSRRFCTVCAALRICETLARSACQAQVNRKLSARSDGQIANVPLHRHWPRPPSCADRQRSETGSTRNDATTACPSSTLRDHHTIDRRQDHRFSGQPRFIRNSRASTPSFCETLAAVLCSRRHSRVTVRRRDVVFANSARARSATRAAFEHLLSCRSGSRRHVHGLFTAVETAPDQLRICPCFTVSL